jgi:hypothetical protein
MYRTDAPNNAPSIPTPSALGVEEYFRDATIGTGTGTLLDADYLNALQESLIAILDDQSVTRSKSDNSKLVEALRSLVDSKIAASLPPAKNYIVGLRTVVTGNDTFEITEGTCRDYLNTSFMGFTGANRAKDVTVAWNTGTGALASGNTWLFGGRTWKKLWAIGKPAPSSDIDFGIDQDNNAANLLLDAGGDGFTTARQIGFICSDTQYTPNPSGIIPFIQSANDPDFWRLPTPFSTGFGMTPSGIFAESQAVMAPISFRADVVWNGCISLSYVPDATFTGHRLGSIGDYSPTPGNVTIFQDPIDRGVSSIIIDSLVGQAPFDVSQGALTAVSDLAARSDLRFDISTEGFRWLRSSRA